MAHSIFLNTAGVDQPPLSSVTYYVARTVVLSTGERLIDVPMSRRVTSIGVANRLLKRACRRAGDFYLVRAWRRTHHLTAPVGSPGMDSVRRQAA